MAQTIKVNTQVEDKSVKDAADSFVKLQTQIKLAEKEYQKFLDTGDSEKIVSARNKLNDLKDELTAARFRGKEFQDQLSVIPGTLGDIASTAGSAIDSMKMLKGITFKDIAASVKAFGEDIKDAARSLLDITGLTKAYTGFVNGLTRAFQALGVAEETAAAAAKGLASAFIALGIGALVIGVAALAANWESVTRWMRGATLETEALNSVNQKVNETYGETISKLESLEVAIKNGNVSQTEKNHLVNDYNTALGDTLGKVKSWEELETKMVNNLGKYKMYLFEKAKAEAAYNAIVENNKRLIQFELNPEASLTTFQLAKARLLSSKFLTTAQYNQMQIASNRAELVSEIDKQNKRYLGIFEEANKKVTEQEKDLKINPEEVKTDKPDKSPKAKKDTVADKLAEAEQQGLAALGEALNKAYEVTKAIRDKEEAAVIEKYRTDLERAKGNATQTAILEQAKNSELAALADKWLKEDTDKEEAASDAKLEWLNYILDLEAKMKADALKEEEDARNKNLEDLKAYQAQQDKIAKSIANSWIDLGQTIGNSFSTLGGLFEEGSDMAKTFGVISVLINAASAIGKVNMDFEEGISSARKAMGAGLASKLQGLAILPINPIQGGALIAAGTTAAAGGSAMLAGLQLSKAGQIASIAASSAAQIAAITSANKSSTSAGGSSGGGGGVNASGVSLSATPTIPAPQIGASTANPNAQLTDMMGNKMTQAPVKAYVLQSDIKSANQFERRIGAASKLG